MIQRSFSTACLCLWLLSSVAILRAQEVRFPVQKLAQQDVEIGSDFKAAGYEVSGSITWARSKLSEAPVLQLGPGSGLTCALEVGALDGKEAEAKLESSYLGVIAVDLAVDSRRAVASRFEIELSHAELSASRKMSYRLRKGVQRDRLLLTIPGDDFKPGTWQFKFRVLGKGNILVEDLSCFRLPVLPAAMIYAKPNGVDGPDRLDSGALGFEAITIDRCALLPIKMVRLGGPAEKAGLDAGDVILEIDGEVLQRNSCKAGALWFKQGHEAQLGRAVETALANSNSTLSLTILRGQQTKTIKLKLAKREALPPDFPFDQDVTPALYDDLLHFVRQTKKAEGYWQNGGNEWIQTCFAGLALLGRRDPQDAETIRQIAEWYLNKFPDPESFGNLGFWAASYSGIFMVEYLLASGDERVRPFIERSLRWIEAGFHTSKWGTPSLGHGPSGLPYDQKALMAPASHVIVFEALALRAGFQSKIWETLLPYMVSAWSDPKSKGGHGAMGYNASYRDQDEFWSRSGLFALAAFLRDEKKHMREALVKVMVERNSYMRNSHAYGNPGDAWGLLALAAVDQKAFKTVMQDWRWSIGGAWEPGYGLRHSTAHMGSPYMGDEGLVNPAYAAVLAARDGGLFLLGAPDQDRGWLQFKKESAPNSSLQIRFNAAGLVEIEAAIPGLPIYYSLDGQAPTRKSTLYLSPFELPAGGLVQALQLRADQGPGPLQSAELGLPKAGWKIVAAEGAKDKTEAKERARALIDDDSRRPWQPDQGEGAAPLPLSVTIDLGETVYLRGLVCSGEHRPAVLSLALAAELSGLETVLERLEVDAKTGVAKSSALRSGRYLRVVIDEMPKGAALRIGEIDPLWPEIEVEEKDGVLRLHCAEPELEVRVSQGDTNPGPKSTLATGRLKKKTGEALRARLFLKSGLAVGPILVIGS